MDLAFIAGFTLLIFGQLTGLIALGVATVAGIVHLMPWKIPAYLLVQKCRGMPVSPA